MTPADREVAAVDGLLDRMDDPGLDRARDHLDRARAAIDDEPAVAYQHVRFAQREILDALDSGRRAER